MRWREWSFSVGQGLKKVTNNHPGLCKNRKIQKSVQIQRLWTSIHARTFSLKSLLVKWTSPKSDDMFEIFTVIVIHEKLCSERFSTNEHIIKAFVYLVLAFVPVSMLFTCHIYHVLLLSDSVALSFSWILNRINLSCLHIHSILNFSCEQAVSDWERERERHERAEKC